MNFLKFIAQEMHAYIDMFKNLGRLLCCTYIYIALENKDVLI